MKAQLDETEPTLPRDLLLHEIGSPEQAPGLDVLLSFCGSPIPMHSRFTLTEAPGEIPMQASPGLDNASHAKSQDFKVVHIERCDGNDECKAGFQSPAFICWIQSGSRVHGRKRTSIPDLAGDNPVPGVPIGGARATTHCNPDRHSD